MYLARFELEDQSWSVAAGRVRAGCPSVVPDALRRAVASGALERLALRCCFGAAGLRTTVLVPRRSQPDEQALVHELGTIAEIEWCDSASQFDAWGAELGERRRWIDAGAFRVDDFAWPMEASFIADWQAWRGIAGSASFVHQLNLVHAPATSDEQRQLRKHLARLDLLANERVLPERMVTAQRRLIERRLSSPWLVDELLSAPDDALCERLQRGLVQRLTDAAGAACAAGAIQSGGFDELMLTGLDSRCFVAGNAVVGASRSLAEATLEAWLGQRVDGRGAARAIDVFVSHASADAPLAVRLCAQLEAAGLRCWIAPRDIGAGANYAQAIIDALGQSRAIVLLLSASALASPHVLRELERAVSYRAAIMPVRLAALQTSGAFDYHLSGCQWTDCLPGTDEQAVAARLAASLARAG